MDSSSLRLLIRAKLADGRLPTNRIPRVWGGPGNGETCGACETIITKDELVMQGIGVEGSRVPIQLHAACFRFWDEERRISRVASEGRFLVGGVALDHGVGGGLLIGERAQGALVYRGTVETGVSPELVNDLAACPLVRTMSPFSDLAQRPGIVWLDPRLTVAVAYEESDTGHLRELELLTIGLDVDEE